MRKKISKQVTRNSNRISELLGIILIGISLFVFLSLVSYDPMDISINAAQPNDPPHNYIGLVGAWFSFFVLILSGLSSFIMPLFLCYLGIRTIWKGFIERFWLWLSFNIINMLSLSCLLELQTEEKLFSLSKHFGLSQFGPGGVLGDWAARGILIKLIGYEGSYILLYSIFILTIIYLTEIKITRLGKYLFDGIIFAMMKIKQFMKTEAIRVRESIQSRAQQKEKVSKNGTKEIPIVGVQKEYPVRKVLYEDNYEAKVRKVEKKEIDDEEKKIKTTEKQPMEQKKVQLELLTQGEYQMPPLKLLEGIGPQDNKEGVVEDLQKNAEILKTTLSEFGVEVDVVNIIRGPVITRYEMQPAPGVKVQSITGLSNDIALAMKAGSVRIIAPIPGKAAVGVEVPNVTSSLVSLKELLESEEFKNSRKKIPIVIGKDVSGMPLIADLTEMPHLLIAGTTGSGKSICMSSIILTLLHYAAPEYLRFLLIDPKMVELSIFNNIPHLAMPVITESRKAAAGLAWLVTEMERRYKLMAEAGARNIEGFNEKVLKEKVTIKSSDEPLKPLPYIIVVIDELADIMIVSSFEVENSIARLAQLSRAIGIHLILATQRPSVDVITGVIKANFPARISFQVSSKVDSRTVLDTIGAEKLLGKGDLLYMPPGSSKLIRAQGPFIRESEIRRVLDFIKQQNLSLNQDVNPIEFIEKVQNINNDLSQLDDESLLEEAIKVIRTTNQASVSILQRKLKIGYSRAARIMDLLEERGVVGPYKGSKARDILIDVGAEER